MERRTEVKTFKVTLGCDRCGGEMRPTGVAIMSSPPQYPHECGKCGDTQNIIDKQYPYVAYEAI